MNPDNVATVYNNRGFAYNKQGEHDRAIADYNRAIEMAPDATAYSNRSGAYHAKGNYDLAIADLEQALQLAPQENKTLINSLIAGMKQAIQERHILDKELETAAGFRARERFHHLAHNKAAASAGALLRFLFGFYAVFFLLLLVYVYKTDINEPLEILPWITAIFLTSSPIIWAIRILNRERARHFALRENAYAHRLMNRLLFDKPKDEHGKEMARRFFDHHDKRGTAYLIISLENGQSDDSGSAVGQIVNTAKEGAEKIGEG